MLRNIAVYYDMDDLGKSPDENTVNILAILALKAELRDDCRKWFEKV